MYFKDLKIKDYFQFFDDLKIYKKINDFQCTRMFQSYPVFEDQIIERVENDLEENWYEIEKRSLWNFLGLNGDHYV